jgi:hypothetical protein
MEGNMNKRFQRLLYRSFDTHIGNRQEHRLQKALDESAALRREKSEIEALRHTMAGSADGSFSPQFAERVFRRLQAAGFRPPAPFDAFRVCFRSLAIVTILLLAALISFTVIGSELLPRGEVFYLPDVSVVKILELPVF